MINLHTEESFDSIGLQGLCLFVWVIYDSNFSVWGGVLELLLGLAQYTHERVFSFLVQSLESAGEEYILPILGHVGKDGLMFKCYIWTWNVPIQSVSSDFVSIACDYICARSCNGSGSSWLFLIIIYRSINPWQVHFIVVTSKNMISGGGMNLGDILIASNGKTIEVRIESHIFLCESCESVILV
jgi:hypothetical protein